MNSNHQPLQTSNHLHWMACGLCVLSLLPISMGALVTTLKAGMAFADWPTSDGQNMLTYPWLKDLSNPERFTEHGHRLAGMLLGVFTICFVIAVFQKSSGIRLRLYASGILTAVILQGMLGGARVLLDKQTLAMTHSITGSLFFCLCLGCALYTSKAWQSLANLPLIGMSPLVAASIVCLPAIVMCQYILGSFFRHLHTLLNEHLIGAGIVSCFTIFVAVHLCRTASPLLRKAGAILVAVLMLQLLLGAFSYVERLGLPLMGYVAVSGSTTQAIICSSHTVGGMFLLGSSFASSLITVRMLLLGKIGLGGQRLSFSSSRLCPPIPSTEGNAQ